MTANPKWYMVTLVGKDRPGIVAHVTSAIFEADGNLGETSMMRLGGNFTIMMMVQYSGNKKSLHDALSSVADSMSLTLHIDKISADLHHHMIPDVRITVYGADRAGIVAKVTNVLTEAGLHILDLESDVAGTTDEPIYVLHIEGHAAEGEKALYSALDIIKAEGIDARLIPIDTLIA